MANYSHSSAFKLLLHKNILSVFVIFNYAYSAAEAEGSSSGKVVVCFVRSWALYRQTFPFNVDKIDPNLCTHLVYMFAGLSDSADDIVSKIKHIDLSENNGNGMYKKMTALKRKNPNLKVLLCVGGSGSPYESFSRLSSSNKKRKIFSNNSILFLRKYGFDGLDLYWFKIKGEEDKENFPSLLQELRKDFSANNLLLTVTVSGQKVDIDNGYALQSISQYVDWINLIVYGYHAANDGKFGIHAPLQSNDEKNIKFSVDYVLSKGVPSNKVVLRTGIQGYGYTNVDETGNAAGTIKGIYDEDVGFLTIFEICEYLDSGWTSVWDNQSSTPIAYKGHKKVSYDDPKSLEIKARYAVEKNMLGIGVSSLDIDDFEGVCKFPGSGSADHKYPLVKGLISGLYNGSSSASKSHKMQPIDGVDTSKNNSSIKVSVIVHDF